MYFSQSSKQQTVDNPIFKLNMNSQYRTITCPSSKYSTQNTLYERYVASTLQPKPNRIQQNLYRDKDRQKERSKQSKQNTNNNYAIGHKEPPQKYLAMRGAVQHNRDNREFAKKNENFTRVMPPKIPATYQTNSKQKYQRSSRVKIEGTQSNTRFIPRNLNQLNSTIQKNRQQHPTNFHNYDLLSTKQYPQNHRNHYQSHNPSQKQYKSKSRLQIYKPTEHLVQSSRITIEHNQMQESQETRIQSRRNMKRSSRIIKQEIITELQCEQELNFFSRKLSATRKSRLRKSEIKQAQQIKLSPQQMIKKFQQQQQNIQKQFNSEVIQLMIKRESQYQSMSYFSNYLDLRQKHINWIKRAVLINWMMEFMVDHDGRRQTLYITVSIVDRYLCTIQHCPLNRLQLVGVTALYIATKLEQSARPAISSFAESTSDVFSQEDIMEQQLSILQCLRYEINSPTLHTWCLRLTIQWDLYLKTQSDQFVTNNIQMITFKNSDQKSYYNYRWLVQLLDFALLDIHTLRYKNRTLVASFMYLILGIKTQQFKQAEVIEQFSSSSQYLKNKTQNLNLVFHKFLEFSFNMDINDLLPTIQYCSHFFILPLTFELPQKVKEEGKQIGYEQFCSYQTINKHNIYCLQKRNRDFD